MAALEQRDFVRHWSEDNGRVDARFCVEALEEAIAKYGKPEIMNTDQGSQFTGAAWITTLADADVKISMPLVTLALPMHCR